MKKSITPFIAGILLAAAGIAKGNEATAQTCTVNLLVAYTSEAATGLQGNQAAITKITAAVQGLHTAFTNSSVQHKVVLVRTVLLSSFETQCFVDDLNNFQASTYINSLRDKYHADVAVLVIANQQFCGLPYIDDALANSTTAYAAVNYSCMVSNFALSHQIAHLYGCSHYIEEASRLDDAPYTFGHGFKWDKAEDYDVNTSYSTIMAQEDADFGGPATDNGIIIPYFSNPAIIYDGVALGLPGVHNNAQVLNNNAAMVAAFMPLPLIQHTLTDTVDLHNIAIATARDTLATGQHYRITDNASVQFKAGSRIVLQPGFTAMEGTRFETFIESTESICSGQAVPRMASTNYPGKLLLSNVVTPADAPVEEAVSVYPNPGHGVFVINFKGIQAKLLEVYNQAGIRIKSIILPSNTNSYQLNLSNEANGIYLLNIKGKNQQVSKKLVKY